MNYRQTLEYLYSQLPMFQRIGAAAYKADLGNTLALLDILDHPENKFRTVHIAGTNGKGSVSHMLASILQESGLKTGLYTSPHLKDFRERIRIDGKMIPKSNVARFVARHRPAFDHIGPSFFEYTAAMAFSHFAREQVDVAVIETGMGGRLDSTNVITPLVSVITNISRDHTAFLGDTLALIAGEKAGIIKNGIPVVIGESHPGTAPVFRARAETCGSRIVAADHRFHAFKYRAEKPSRTIAGWNIHRDGKPFLEGLKCPLTGDYQGRNIQTVMAVIEELNEQGIGISREQIRAGIEKTVKRTGLMGRWQTLGRKPLIICDVGHNEAGIRCIVEQLKGERYRNLHWVFGMVSDKDSGNILALLPASAIYYFCKAAIPRGKDARELQTEAVAFGLKGRVYGSVKEAFEAAKSQASAEDLIFVGGSTFVVAEVL